MCTMLRLVQLTFICPSPCFIRFSSHVLTYSTEARFALVISAWAANKGAIRQKPVWGVAVVELIMLCLIALATVGVVNVGIEGPAAMREVF